MYSSSAQILELSDGRRLLFPFESRGILGNVFGHDRKGILYGIDGAAVSAGVALDRGGKRFFALGQNISCGTLLGFHEIVFAVLSDKPVYLQSSLFVLRNKTARLAKIMLRSHPEEVEQKKVVLSRPDPCAPSHHLRVKGSDLCRPQYHNAVDLGTVPAFSQKHCIAENVVFPVSEVIEDLPPVFGFSVYFGS